MHAIQFSKVAYNLGPCRTLAAQGFSLGTQDVDRAAFMSKMAWTLLGI